ncbi:MAG TPA: ATP-dependent zinc metalloprotease FtsH [Nitriliruptorales bacterium]|nr:ATP-dependent zinc metalloprotease FtsH [Nitriliruptorales bacterium]
MANQQPGRKRVGRRAVFWVALCIPALLVLYGLLMYFTLPRTYGDEASLGRFFRWAGDGQIQSATLLSVDNRVFFNREGRPHWVALPPSTQYLDRFVDQALTLDTPLDVDQQDLKTLLEPASYLLPALLIVTAFVLFFLLMRSGGSPFLRAAARRGATEHPVTFADVAGVVEAVDEVREVRDYLMDPDRFRSLGAEPPRGILLIGPPGTGKTLLARAVAGEAGVPFFSISGTDFVEMYVGVGAARVRDLFRQVRDRAPAILFIDELDAVGRTRIAGATAGQDERDQTLNQLLVELDGFQRDTGVVLIGATNRPDILDPALLRRGRFDRQITFDRPDRDGRTAILEVHARGKQLAPSVDLAAVAAATPGFTGADLASVLNEAALLAARRRGDTITPADLEEAIDRVLAGSEGRVRLLTPRERRAVACHESGHAVVAWALPDGGPVTKVSIVGRGRSLGFTRIVPGEERFVVVEQELQEQLTVILAGRAAEELMLGQATSSSKDDLRRATALARRMVCEFGMSETLGRRALGQPLSSSFLDEDGRLEPDYSGEVAALIDREIKMLVDRAFARATAILVEHRHVLDDLATRLVERETLHQHELSEFATAVAPSSASAPGTEPDSASAAR